MASPHTDTLLPVQMLHATPPTSLSPSPALLPAYAAQAQGKVSHFSQLAAPKPRQPWHLRCGRLPLNFVPQPCVSRSCLNSWTPAQQGSLPAHAGQG